MSWPWTRVQSLMEPARLTTNHRKLLDESDLARILEHLERTQTTSGCPRCGGMKYSLTGPLVQTYSTSTVYGGHPELLRVAALSCKTCGSVEFIDLKVVGL